MTDSRIAECRLELADVLRSIATEDSRQASARDARATRLFDLVRDGRNVAASSEARRRIDIRLNSVIRQIHNSFGLKAMHGVAQKGVCAGALFRSERYLRIPASARSGTKPSQNVHIEHTAQVGVLIRALHRHGDQFASPFALQDFLISHSVCAGVHIDEKQPIGNQPCPAFGVDGSVSDFPFLRYQAIAKRDPQFRLVNVIRGAPVILEEFTFAHHREALMEAESLVTDGKVPHSSLYFRQAAV